MEVMMGKTDTLMSLKEFMEYTGFKMTYTRQLLLNPRNRFATKIG